MHMCPPLVPPCPSLTPPRQVTSVLSLVLIMPTHAFILFPLLISQTIYTIVLCAFRLDIAGTGSYIALYTWFSHPVSGL